MLEKISKLALWLVVTAVALVLTVCTIIPRVNNWVPLTVLSGSMTGSFNTGDLIVVRPITDEGEQKSMPVGTIVAFYPRPNDLTDLTTHRIVDMKTDGSEVLYTTKGDANPVDDPKLIFSRQVAGEYVYKVPKMGFVASALAPDQKKTLTWLVAGSLFAYAAFNVFAAVKPARRRDAEQTEIEEASDVHAK